MSDLPTTVSGSDASRYKVIRLDSYADAIEGELLSADCMGGDVSWKDSTGTIRQKNFGAHVLRLVPKR